MKMLNVRVPDRLVKEIELESRKRNISKSQVVRERIEGKQKPKAGGMLGDIADLIGSIDGLPTDVSARKKYYLRKGYGRKSYR
jgi:hypothetical protein